MATGGDVLLVDISKRCVDIVHLACCLAAEYAGSLELPRSTYCHVPASCTAKLLRNYGALMTAYDRMASWDCRRGPLRWHISYNLAVLRMMSYGMDLHWARQAADGTRPVVSGGGPSSGVDGKASDRTNQQAAGESDIGGSLKVCATTPGDKHKPAVALLSAFQVIGGDGTCLLFEQWGFAHCQQRVHAPSSTQLSLFFQVHAALLMMTRLRLASEQT